MSTCPAGSTPAVGSSRMSRSGSCNMARPRARRWRMPLENVPTLSSRPVAEPRQLQHGLDAALGLGHRIDLGVVGEIVVRGHAVVEAVGLEHEPYAGPDALLVRTQRRKLATLPESAWSSPSMIRMLVVLPAPLGPEKPEDVALLRRQDSRRAGSAGRSSCFQTWLNWTSSSMTGSGGSRAPPPRPGGAPWQ